MQINCICCYAEVLTECSEIWRRHDLLSVYMEVPVIVTNGPRTKSMTSCLCCHSESTLYVVIPSQRSVKLYESILRPNGIGVSRSGIFWPPGVSVPEVLHAVAIMHGSVTFN